MSPSGELERSSSLSFSGSAVVAILVTVSWVQT
jgi:hypothetical protein